MQLDTINEATIISLLPLVAGRGWAIRTVAGNPWIYDLDGRCPVCSLLHEISGGEIDETLNAMTGFKKLTGTEDYNTTVSNIMSAADGRYGHCPALRASIMRHLGMVN